MTVQNTALFSIFGWPGILVGALVILAITVLLSRVLVSIFMRSLHRGTGGQVGGTIWSNIIRVCVWLVGIAAILYFCFDFNVALLWGALGIGGIALSLGMQNTVSNLIGGLQISLSKEIAIGDWVEVDGISGEVKDITWAKMMLQDGSGNLHNVPNLVLNSCPVTRLCEWFTLPLSIVVAPGYDIDVVKKELPGVVADALEEAGMRYANKDPVFCLNGIELTGISCTLTCFAKREFTSQAVSDTAMSAALFWFGEHDDSDQKEKSGFDFTDGRGASKAWYRL